MFGAKYVYSNNGVRLVNDKRIQVFGQAYIKIYIYGARQAFRNTSYTRVKR